MTNPEQREKIARDALEDLIKCADAMPKKTPAPGSCVTEHQFTIEAGVIWALDMSVQRARTDLAAIIALDLAPESVIPTGMKPWAGGKEAPSDWDGGPLLCGDASIWHPRKDQHPYIAWSNVPAYTPRPAPDVKRKNVWTVWDAEARMARDGDWRGVAYSIAHDILPLIPEGSPDHAYQERARMQIKAADRLCAAVEAASLARSSGS